jgi:Tol biopolymer transport system component
LSAQDAPLSFAWSPDATRIASVAGYGQVVVIDAQTGKTVATSSQSDVVAQFWAPGGDRLAYLVVNRGSSGAQARLRANGHTPVEQAAGGLTWYILDIQSGQDHALVSFSPTREMVYLLNFADQFAHSHSLWSPDGRYLAYGATDIIGKSSVMIVDTRATNATNPIKVGTGTIGIWSWR